MTLRPRRSKLSPWLGGALLCTTVLNLHSCGKDGDGASGGDRKPVDAPLEDPDGKEDPLALRTEVRFRPLAYQSLSGTGCALSLGAQEPKEVTALSIDGDFSEWTAQTTDLTDALADAPAAADLGAIFLGLAQEGLALAVAWTPTNEFNLHVELGGQLIRSRQLSSTVRRHFRLREDRLEESVDKSWRTLESNEVNWIVGVDGLELSLSRRLLGDVVTWPSWWIRLYVSNADGLVLDSTQAVYYKTLLHPDNAAFFVSGCQAWPGREMPVSFQHLADAPSAVMPRDFPVAEVSERIHTMARLAVDSTAHLLDRSAVPLTQLALMATTSQIPEVAHAESSEGVGALYRAIIIDMNRLGPRSTEVYPEGGVFVQVAGRFIELTLHGAMQRAPQYLRKALLTASLDALVKKELGLGYWLDHYRDGVIAFLTTHDTDAPKGLASDTDLTLRHAKATAFGHLLGAHFTPRELLAAWKTAGSTERPAEAAFRQALTDLVQTDSKRVGTIASLWPGWVDSTPYAKGFEPDSLDDPDLDGLPSYLETQMGTDPFNADTDGDGWTDFAELTGGEDPLRRSSTPLMIVPDGSFEDWLELMPKRVIIDRGSSGACPKAADITHYAAIADRETLLVGAFAQDFAENESAAHWEVVLDFPEENRQFLLTAAGGERSFVLKEPVSLKVLKRFQKAMPVARQTIEWVIARNILGIAASFDQPEAVKIRLRTTYTSGGETHFCDETSWFSPYVTE